MLGLEEAKKIAETYMQKEYKGLRFGEYSETDDSYLFSLDIDWVSVNKNDGSIKVIWFKDLFEDDDLLNEINKNRRILRNKD